MGFEDLSPEIQEKLKACKTEEELRELAKTLGTELSDEELGAVSGGACRKDCPLDEAICRHGGCPAKTSCLLKDICSTWSCEEFCMPTNPECTELIDGDEVFPCKVLDSLVPK